MIKNLFKNRSVIVISMSILVSLLSMEFIIKKLPHNSFSYLLLNSKLNISKSLELGSNATFKVSQQCIDDLNRLDSIYKNTEEKQLNDKLWIKPIDLFTIYNFLSNISQFSNYNRLSDSDRIPFFEVRHNTIFKDLKESLETDGNKRFLNKLNTIYSNEPQVLAAINLYLKNRINQDGYRSIEFQKLDTKRKKILLIGDSYTYGFSAMPFYNSFADLLLSDGYVVYNGGMPGTGVINYDAVAQAFISKIQPDIVITLYYEDNDAINFNWDGGAYLPGHFIEQGLLPTFVNGQYVPEIDRWLDSLNSCVCKKMKLSFLRKSILYNLLFHKSIQNHINSCISFGTINEQLTNQYLTNIERAATENNADHYVVVISTPMKDIYQIKQKYQNSIFNNLNTFYPNVFTKDDYRSEIDLHFNNSGNLKLKNFIVDSVLNK